MEKSKREEELEGRIKKLETELSVLKSEGPRRTKVKQMSSEVADSNPYRSVL